MKIGIDCGHSLNGSDYGASGIKEESNITRELGNKVIELLTNKGHEVVNCTVDYCDSLNDSLYRRYNTANTNNCDYFISIHFNAFDNSAHGTEILYYSETDDKMERILSNLVSLGLTNRGLKQRTELAVLKHTNMTAMLIECAFCDSSEDMDIYNADSFANAIVSGFLGETLTVSETIKTDNSPTISTQSDSTSTDSITSGTIGIVTASKLNVRDYPSANGNIIGTLNSGEKVTIDKVYGDWLSTFFGDHGGYVNKNYVNIISDDNLDGVVATVTNITSYLNVRDSIGGNVIGKLYNGDQVTLFKKEGNYYHTYFGEHGGYVSADYITI